ncbi:MAG TPA: hypothetical protein VEC56_01240 [Candidatus Krumholzibacteria bacterium]|nr:hypothetical protein [Candidatus Krumholzibacteria bacterium]
MSESRSKSAVLAAGIAWVLVYFGCRLILDRVALPDWVRIVVALSPIVPFAFFLGYAIANVRSMDELHRRVHLEALAFAFPAGVVVLMVLGLLQLVFTFHPQRFNFRDAWPILLVLYCIGLAWNWRRYL